METENREIDNVTLDANHVNTLQELLSAVGALPGVLDRVEAWMMARNIEDPLIELEALRKMVF